MTRRRFAPLLLTAALGLGGAAQARPFTARDLVSLDRVSDPHVSPDGRAIAYDVRSTDLAANTGVHAVWLLQAGQPRKLTGDATSPRWSADGKALFVLSGRSGSDQVWRVGLDGGAPMQVTHLPLDVGAFRVSPDGRTLVVSMAVFPDCETPACTAQRVAGRKADKASGQVFDHLFVRHWDTWADGTRNHLFAVRLDGGGDTAVPLMAHFDGDTPSKPFGGDEDFALSPDGRTVFFSARTAGRTEPWSTNFDIWRAPVDGSAPPVDLTAANPAWDAEPVVSADGRSLAYRAQTRPGFESDRFGVWVMDLVTGRTREVAPHWDRSAGHLAWSPDGTSLIVTADDEGSGKLFRLAIATGAVQPLTNHGHVGDYDVGPQGAVYTADAFDRPADLWAMAPGQPARQLTHANAERLADTSLSPGELFTFAGWNGETVHGYLFKPTGYQPGAKYPVAFLIHGGPQGSWDDDWSYRWNPQTYAGLGYGVVVVDFHGSTGYGQAFTDAISGHWGDRPLEDLQKGWAASLAKAPWLDGDRACALGASYGGFMIDWMAGVWNTPWKCLVVHDGVFDTRMMGYETEEQWFSEWENGGGGMPWRNPQGFERFNPVDHVAQWTKPILVIHSAKDYRIPLDQGLAAFTAAQSRDLPSEFLTFPDENHWVLKPANSLQWHATVEAWLKRWTGG
ncbi:prolyl oligopeptidase family serine peptidase [Caulobacter sp. S45]|uniref:prolyl oligopeptidase family serine peptidase n=1 Tax=Caulobacter sp. S45 TaxID=1641861 RepID=UPI0035301527